MEDGISPKTKARTMPRENIRFFIGEPPFKINRPVVSFINFTSQNYITENVISQRCAVNIFSLPALYFFRQLGGNRGRTMTYSDVIKVRLQYLIAQRGITVNKLATLSGITQSTVEDVMNGRTKNPKLKTLHRLACGLDMTVSELLDFPEMNETQFDDE